MPSKRKPSYLLHKSTGQARVRINGKDHYLGEYGSPESRQRYDEIIAEWFAKLGDVGAYSLTLDDLALLFFEHAKQHYRKNGVVTSEVSCVKTALRYVVQMFGPKLVRDFGPRRLKVVRQAMIDDGHCRTSINKHIGRVRRMFRWAVENEYVPVEVHTALTTVQGLQRGRCKAIEKESVKPVPVSHVEAVERFVTPPVWAMIQLQLLTGMRPGAALIMRASDVDMTSEIWGYVPRVHKTEHQGRQRIILIGPKAQKIIRNFKKNDPQAYFFRRGNKYDPCPRRAG